jgi:deoxycytidylate deaminase
MIEFCNLSKSWRRGFDAAAAISIYSTGQSHGLRLGAALYAGSNLLSLGFNDWNQTHPRSTKNEFAKNLHAEHAALLKRRHYDNARNLIMYVYRARINPDTDLIELACSRPCDNCMTLLESAKVRRIRFIDENGFANEISIRSS